MAGQPDNSDRRSWRRFFLHLGNGANTCRVRDDKGRMALVRVVNISIGGAQLQLAQDAANQTGEALRFKKQQELSFEDCDVGKWGRHLCGASGFVRWVAEDRECGCQFFEPLGAAEAKK